MGTGTIVTVLLIGLVTCVAPIGYFAVDEVRRHYKRQRILNNRIVREAQQQFLVKGKDQCEPTKPPGMNYSSESRLSQVPGQKTQALRTEPA